MELSPSPGSNKILSKKGSLRSLFLMCLFYFYQFNLEVQLLACHLMVGVEGDGLLVLGCHLYREGLAELIGQIYALTYL